MLDGGYLPIQLRIYIPMYLYGYIAIRLCVYKCISGTCFRLPGYCPDAVDMFPYVGVFVRGGDGALARTRVVAPVCVGGGGSALGGSTRGGAPHTPALVIHAALCCHEGVEVGRH